ncbi:hypothetical protein VT84_37290 [Gemmata sp. SH-PL17]|uniref:hypothetical protein n=1 Tax=Gemmata sp. SH-PL17 TaxID=1630693 RepID=UPI0004BB0B18|nr:hypothetical protein [Gemmata sp. SH-PL17]AMV30108.1 hypothetical protein VT84_37290 [Gemmata sp. SH-PL17]
MRKRLVYLGLVAAVAQICSTGCLVHPVARWRANHPCIGCDPQYRPLLHPIQTRRAMLGIGEPIGPAGPVVGPVVGPVSPPCHGCGASPVVSGPPIEGVPITPTGYPTIGYPIPITPGPTVIPSNQLPNPMPVPKS